MIYTEDTCPNGMRRTYLDETTASEEGAARNYVPALNFYEGNGALWYRRKVLIEPRFEVHLKASIEPVDIIENSNERNLQGFTIVISKNKNKLSLDGPSDYLGYYGFTKSYIIEFDFNKNRNDPDDSSYSFRYCDSECSNDDANAFVYDKLNAQRYDPTSTMNWDFRLIYSDKKLYLYSGVNTLLFSYNVDLSSSLESNTAYIGFTGNMNGNRRELSVLGTFICEDNFDISRMVGSFYVDDNSLETYTYKAGETVQYLFSFINNKGQVVPHCFKQGIWTYSFSLSLDCPASNLQIRMKDEYSLLLSMSACHVLGEHTIGISEATHGVGPERKYTIIGGDLNTISLIGHDGILSNIDSYTTLVSEARRLTYGASEGDFPLKGTSFEIVLDFECKDSFGNNANIGSTSSEMLKSTGLSLATANSATLSMRKYEDHYQLVIKVVKTGTYKIVQNSFLPYEIQFVVIVGGVSTSTSYCTLDKYTSIPTLKKGNTINYNCFFKDGKGNIMSIKTFTELNEYDFSCETKRTSPSTKTYTNTFTANENFYQCEFQITETGTYEFYGYLTPKGKTTKTKIKGTIYKFNVMGSVLTLNNANIFNYYTKKWVSIETNKIEYRNDASGKLTSLDLLDSDANTLISKYKVYPEDFDVNKIKIKVYSSHDWNKNFGNFYPKIYTLNGIQYIGIFNELGVKSDNIFKKSSFGWTLKITYEKDDGSYEEKNVELVFSENDLKISPYKTCFHDLDISKTNLEMSYNVELVTGGAETKIAKIELRTSDYNLYNYDIGKSNIKFTLEGSGNISFRVEALSIKGVYEIYATAYSDYWGNIIIKVKNVEIGRRYSSAQQALACYLNFTNPELFRYLRTESRDHYYEYLGDFVDGNFQYWFTVLDKYKNVIVKSDYFSTFADIYSHQYGNDERKFSIFYNTEKKAFEFRDKLEFNSGKYTWVFFMRDSTCNNKYLITYDQARIITSVAVSASYYNLLNTYININEYSYVEVFLKDGTNAFIGLTDGRLEEIKGNVVVKAKDTNTNQIYEYQFEQITSNYAIRFKNVCKVAGYFEVTAYYNNNEMHCGSLKYLAVIAPRFSITVSKLQVILDSTIEMSTQVKTSIKNMEQIPFYNLYLYTSNGEQTTYDSNAKFTCTMTGYGATLDLVVTKKTDFIQFSYKTSELEKFKALKKGDYILTLTGSYSGNDEDNETKEYPLYLYGDGNDDCSNEENFDLTKTFIDPNHIDGFAGKAYTILFEFRAKDNLRWNYWGTINSFSFQNSYGLSSNDLIIKVTQGYKKGQYMITVTQNTVTLPEKGDNILYIKYNEKQIDKSVSLNIKGGDFAKLILVDGPTPGNVIDPPILTFKPVDKFNNQFTFDSSVTQEYLKSLTIGKSLDGVSLTTNNYLSNGLLKVQYKTTISTNVKVTSQYFEDKYKDIGISYRIKSGPIDPETSYAEMKSSTAQAAGSNYTIVIYPKDTYLNDIDDLNIEDMNKFLTYYQIVENETKINVTNCKLVEGYSSAIDIVIRKLTETEQDESVYDSIECITPIEYIGNIAFHVKYIKDEIECKNCVFSVIASQFDFSNTRTLYKNKEYYLKLDVDNEVEAKKEPIFELSFYDQFNNIITDVKFVEELDIEAIFEGADIKLCVSNSGNKKLLTLCPSTNGDDNINKWQYITNGNNYALIVQQKSVSTNNINYPIKIIGGYDGSSGEEDFSKTYFNPSIITIQAGNEGKTIMEIRTGENVRKNYWYPDISEKIKVEFNKDKDNCTYIVEKGDLPGQYAIRVTCTKANNDNSFTVTVDSNVINQDINLVVNCGPAYYLEIEEEDKFTVSGDKYTWKKSQTNDDNINFLFKLQDKYKNYITTSVIGTTQISISSELYGINENYYNLEFKNENKDYLFTDKIYTAITKHTWTIICTESNKKYSFTYNRIAGKVDTNKSYWEIDKTAYILKETSTVLVTLVDKYGVNIGTIEGQLLKEKEKVKVYTNNGKDLLYGYNSITNDINMKYLYQYILIDDYEVRVTYDGIQIGKRENITVSYQTIDLQKSQLFYIIENEELNLMLTSTQTNINNLKYCPYYILHLYTATGERITLYDKKISVKCSMVYSEFNSWELDVDKKDDHIYLAHKDCDSEFHKLPEGLYYLKLTIKDQLAEYPLYLMGEKNVSPYNSYDLSKTYIKPTFIDGIAGQEYLVDIEFRAQDGLRWNYEVNINSLTYRNSYSLSGNQLSIRKEIGEKNGQMRLYITQYVTTKSGQDNIIYLEYDQKEISQYITLRIKCHPELKELVYHSGAEDGTVIKPSIVKFIPKDKYGNLYTDLFNQTLYTKEKLEKLTQGESLENHEISTNNYVDGDEMFLYVQYGCKKVTTIKLTANNYNPNTYIYKLWSGPIDPDTSYAKIEKTDNIKAGDTTKLTIYPRDIYENIVTNATQNDFKKFDVYYEINQDYKEIVSDTCETTSFNDNFDCKTGITKAGNVEFTVEYDDRTVKCLNCKFNINPDKLDFSKTKVYNKNENKEMSKTELNSLPVTIKPNFLLNFFDQYYNPIVNKEEIDSLKVSTEIIVTDVKLCVSNNELSKLSSLCKSQNNDENEERWQFLPNGDDYKLIVSETTKNEKLTYPVQLTGGYTDGDSGPVDTNKTYINPQEITLVAGEEGLVFMELRTKENKRKNYWYKNIDENIKIKFSEDHNCTYSLSKAEKPGQYNIKFKCYKKSNPFNANIEIENKEVPTPILITVIPNSPYTSKLFTMSDEEITTSYLGSVSVEDSFQMINKLYDRYNNLITNINNLASLQIKMVPTNYSKYHTWSAETAAQATGEIIITLKSTYAYEHIVVGAYFPLEKYTIIFTPGSANADNSELEVSDTEKFVGETVKIFITPKDKYNNYIDAYQYKDNSPYQIKYTNEADTTRIITQKHEITVKDEHNVLSYDAIFYIRGMTYISGYIDTEPIKCVSCIVNVKSKDIDFLNYKAFRFESAKNDFETLKNGTVENNTKEEPIYRLYPRDQYGNVIDIIPQKDLLSYNAYLKSQNQSITYKLKLNNNETNNQEYAEFTIDDKGQTGSYTYATLVEGFYDLEFTNGKDKLVFNITLTGTGKGGSNEEADFQNTHIIEQNLKYVAGKTGYMIIEIRTKNNIRKNFWEGFNFTIESSDKTDNSFKFVQERAGTLGVFYITVTSTKANTYPNLTECTLNIFVNGIKVEKLKPQMEVSPDTVVRTKILPKYYKDGKNSKILVDGTTDQNYVFEVFSYDQYNNLAETLQEVVGIKVSLRGGNEVNKTTSMTDQETGYRKYSAPITKAGTYIVSTDKSGPQGLYLENESIFVVSAGVIDLSKTIIKEKSSPIQAGTKPGIIIDAFDKYGNPLDTDDYIDKFKTTFIDPKNDQHSSSGLFDDILQKVTYISDTPVNVTGLVKVTVIYDEKDKLDTSNVIIEVIPGETDPSKSILSREITKGTFVQYKNGSSFIVDTNELLILNVTLYDKYNNFISKIPVDVDILDPIMSGNYMTEIPFTIDKYDSYFNLDFNDNETYIHIYQHLVKGTYDLTYKVKTSLTEASFKYNIIIENGDDLHGNGPYVIEKCILTPKNTSFVAGNFKDFTLELRTEQGLLYNDDIDIENDTLIELIELQRHDDSFYYNITKTGNDYGIYTITIYSHVKGKYIMKVFLTDPKSEERRDVNPVEYYVHPDKVPYKEYTVIKNIKENEQLNVKADTNFEISFTLADKFNNSFEGRNDIIDNNYLTLLNNVSDIREPISVVSMSMNSDNVYKLIVYPVYPPKTMRLNVLYNDEENAVDCFMKDIIVNIITTIDYYQTVIVSKNKERITVGEYLDMQLYTFDKKGECFDDTKDYSSHYSIVVTGPMDTLKQSTVKYSVKKTLGNSEEECHNEYKIIIIEEVHKYKYAGNYVIKVFGDDKLIDQFKQLCIPKDYELFFIDYNFDPNHISVLETASFTITGTDEYLNKVSDPLLNDISIDLSLEGVKVNEEEYSIEKYEIIPGELHYNLEVYKIGKYQLHMYFKENEILRVNDNEPLPILTFEPGPCYTENNTNFYLSELDGKVTEKLVSFKFQCYDMYNNKITKGGEDFSIFGTVIIDNEDSIELNNVEIVDNNNGLYTVSFIPNIAGRYILRLFNNKEKYGEDISILYKEIECKGSTPILCPDNRCVSNSVFCIDPPNGCDEATPFRCKVNNTETCVKSQIECDCPKGYIKCGYMNYCVRENRTDMCPSYKKLRCPTKNYIQFQDGICRDSNSRGPSQIVCPIGYILCPDLTCKKNHDDCLLSEELPINKFRCVEQTIKTYPRECPSTISCINPTDVVCFNGKCVDNEIKCPKLTECRQETPYLCNSNYCAKSPQYCPKFKACGNGNLLCEDTICRTNCTR